MEHLNTSNHVVSKAQLHTRKYQLPCQTENGYATSILKCVRVFYHTSATNILISKSKQSTTNILINFKISFQFQFRLAKTVPVKQRHQTLENLVPVKQIRIGLAVSTQSSKALSCNVHAKVSLEYGDTMVRSENIVRCLCFLKHLLTLRQSIPYNEYSLQNTN